MTPKIRGGFFSSFDIKGKEVKIKTVRLYPGKEVVLSCTWP